MAIIDSLLERQNEQPVAPQGSWVKDLIDKRYQPKTERLKRKPVGFDFKRDPFDPSSYYRALETGKNINVAATNVVRQEAANAEEARRQREFDSNQKRMMNALGQIDPRFTYSEKDDHGHDHGNVDYSSGKGRKYRLGGVAKNVAKAADYFGNKYGIGSIGGYRERGSVPGSDHPKGKALDFMTSEKRRGDALTNDLIKNAKSWSVKYVIWWGYIWSPGRGWRKYNGPSAHKDHVHASFH